MKRYGKTERLYDEICAETTIENAMRHALIKHKYPNMRVPDYTRAQKYMLAHWDECKETVLRTLTTESYQFHELHSFKVYEPKERIINCPQFFPDKIILVCVYMVLREYFYSKFVRNTYNCIKGRGIHDAKRAIERIMQKYPDWHYCQTDIRKFYPTIRHDVIKEDLARVFKDTKVLRILYAIVDMFHEGIDEKTLVEIGIAIGVNLSQLMAILILIPVLRDINEKWKYPCVGFTDDVFVAIPNKQKCHEFMYWYIARCEKRGMHVKPNYRIAPMREPLRMIGYEFRINERGQQYTLLGKPIKQRMKKRARQLAKMKLSDDEWKQQMASYFGWCKHACCKNLMRKTFGERYKLFEKNMRTFKDIKGGEIGEFGIARENRVSVVELLNQPICFDDARKVIITQIDEKTGEKVEREKVAIKFRYVENNEPVGEPTYLISGSKSLKDRATDIQPQMPFIGTIVERHTSHRSRYYVIE